MRSLPSTSGMLLRRPLPPSRLRRSPWLQVFDAVHRRRLGALLTLPQGHGVPRVVCSGEHSCPSAVHLVDPSSCWIHPFASLSHTCPSFGVVMFTGSKIALPLASEAAPPGAAACHLPPWQDFATRGGWSSSSRCLSSSSSRWAAAGPHEAGEGCSNRHGA